MKLTPGDDWGTTEPVPQDAIWVSSDSEARDLVVTARRSNNVLPRLCLTGGDLARCLGGGKGVEQIRESGATHVSVDVGATLIDGRINWFIAHLVARHRWLRGRVVVVANTDFLGRWNIAPRAHPGDGLLDLVDSDLGVNDRIEARRRLPSGTHVPHPEIRYERRRAFQLTFDRPTLIRLDGTKVGTATQISVHVESNPLDVWI